MRPPGGGRRPTTGGRSEVSAGKAQRRVFEERRPHRSDRAETGRRRDPRGRREASRRAVRPRGSRSDAGKGVFDRCVRAAVRGRKTGRRGGDTTPEGNAATDAAPPRGHSIASSPTLDRALNRCGSSMGPAVDRALQRCGDTHLPLASLPSEPGRRRSSESWRRRPGAGGCVSGSLLLERAEAAGPDASVAGRDDRQGVSGREESSTTEGRQRSGPREGTPGRPKPHHPIA